MAVPSVAEKGIIILGGAIEFGFTGEVRFTIFNLSRRELHFPCETRIARLIPHIICYPILQEAPNYSCQIIMNNQRKNPIEKLLLHVLYKYIVTHYYWGL